MRYKVKYPWPAKLPEGEEQTYAYGIYRYNQEGAKPGFTVVDDAVLPVARLIPSDQVEDVKESFESMFETDPAKMPPYQRYVYEHEQAERAKSDALKDGELVGAMFSVGVADGSATYVVTRATKTKATVEWRGYCADRYVDRILGYGGTFPRAVIERQVLSARALARFFGQSKHAKKGSRAA